MLYRVIYISASKTLLGPAETEELLKRSRPNNVAAGITGILVYHDGGFFQVLEGPRAPVEKLFATIRTDPRHHRVIALWQGAADARLFGNWGMGFVPPEGWPRLPGEGVELRGLLRSTAPWAQDRVVGPLVRRFLRSYRDLSV